MQTGYETVGLTIGWELFDRVRRRGARPQGRPPGAHQARRPPGAERARCPSSSARAAAACCSTRRAATASRPTSSARARRCSRAAAASRSPSPLVTLVDDGTMAEEWGCFAIDDEGTPAAAQRPHRGRRPHRLHVGLPPRPQGRPAPLRQRPPPELPAPADGADDQHVPARRPRRPRRRSSPAPSTACTSRSLGGGQVNTATGDFVFGMTEAYLIEDGEITDPIREGNLIGNGPEGAHAHRRRRQRLRHGPARACAARTARACPSATASRPCGSPSSPSAAPPA